jgi:hypothetical protein
MGPRLKGHGRRSWGPCVAYGPCQLLGGPERRWRPLALTAGWSSSASVRQSSRHVAVHLEGSRGRVPGRVEARAYVCMCVCVCVCVWPATPFYLYLDLARSIPLAQSPAPRRDHPRILWARTRPEDATRRQTSGM